MKAAVPQTDLRSAILYGPSTEGLIICNVFVDPFFKEPHNVSILTLYRPNFCCECGAKIVRLRWNVWSSRKFCGACQPHFRKEHWLQPGIAIVALLFLGIMFGRAMRPAPPPLLIQRSVISANTTGLPQTAPSIVAEDIYLCGARTKKGTPCSRRVHGPVRCWQHKGMPAMLPTEKLKIRE